jgi:cytidine deaminase
MRKVNFKNLKHEEQILVEMAKKARENAYAPYSKYKVGAAVMSITKRGPNFYSGCNVETCIYQTTHAERNAIDTMVADGCRQIIALCCVTKGGGIPCAECRQFIWEFCGDNPEVPIISVDIKGNIEIYTIGELYPKPFGPKDLGVNPEKY